jgi:hypothetical protein
MTEQNLSTFLHIEMLYKPCGAATIGAESRGITTPGTGAATAAADTAAVTPSDSTPV